MEMSGQRHRLFIRSARDMQKGRKKAERERNIQPTSWHPLSNHRMFAEIGPEHKHTKFQTYTRIRNTLAVGVVCASWMCARPNNAKFLLRSNERAYFILICRKIENYFIIVIIITWNEQTFGVRLRSRLFSRSVEKNRLNSRINPCTSERTSNRN